MMFCLVTVLEIELDGLVEILKHCQFCYDFVFSNTVLDFKSLNFEGILLK
jgi:hypothetical protein